MTEVVYPGPYPAVETPDGTVFVIDVPTPTGDEQAENLIRQGFKPFVKEEGKK